MRTVLRVSRIILLGGIGGVLMVGLLLPMLKYTIIVRSIPFLQHIAEGTTVIEHTQQLVVDENSALEAAVSNAQKNIVEVQVTEKNTVFTTTGAVLTNDGIVVFPDASRHTSNIQYLVRGSGSDWVPATLLAEDPILGLVLLRSQNLQLSPVGFGDVQSLDLGQRIFALGVLPDGRNFAAEGIVTSRATSQKNGETSLRLDLSQGNGAGLFSLDGAMFGMFRTQRKMISLVPSSDIQQFLQRTLAAQ